MWGYNSFVSRLRSSGLGYLMNLVQVVGFINAKDWYLIGSSKNSRVQMVCQRWLSMSKHSMQLRKCQLNLSVLDNKKGSEVQTKTGFSIYSAT